MDTLREIIDNAPHLDILNRPQDRNFHNPNAKYAKGNAVYEGDDLFVAHSDVPPNQNIFLTNLNYWSHMAGIPKPTMNILQEQNEMANPPLTNYLVGCAGIIFDEDGNLLIGERVDFDGNPVRALFGGKPEYYETLAQGMAREGKEELHLAVAPERWTLIGIREASPGIGKRCLTAFFTVKITNEEKARIVNAEPHKCKQLIWDRCHSIVQRGLWQNSEAEVMRAFSMLFGRFNYGR